MHVRRYGRLAVLVWLASLGWLVSVGYAETVYVQAKSAQLRSGKTSLSPVVATVQFREALEKLRQEDDWYQVRTTAGVTGWIFANKTSPSRPSGGDGTLAKLGQSMRQGEATPVTASTGARGLDKVSDEYARRAGIPQRYRAAVDRMTAYTLSDREVEAFLQEGRLGEYAR